MSCLLPTREPITANGLLVMQRKALNADRPVIYILLYRWPDLIQLLSVRSLIVICIYIIIYRMLMDKLILILILNLMMIFFSMVF